MLTAEKHPQADKLQVLTVDAGTGEPIQVVCGAPNARAGLVGVFGAARRLHPGQRPDLEGRGDPRRRKPRHDVLVARARAGRRPYRDHRASRRTRRSARAFTDYAGLDDPVFDVNVTPNRQDCMGVRGIARDLAAAGMGTLKPLGVPQIEGSLPVPGAGQDRRSRGLPGFLRPRGPRA